MLILHKNIHYRDGSDEGSQHMVSVRIKKNIIEYFLLCRAVTYVILKNLNHFTCDIGTVITVIILNIGTDRSEQTVQTQIRLLHEEQSDQGLLCLLFCLHLLNTILHCKIQLFQL